MKKLVVTQQGVGVAVGRRPQDKRLEDLTSKPGKSQAETLEEILLRIKRIEEHLSIT